VVVIQEWWPSLPTSTVARSRTSRRRRTSS
jgi:hypothetical protein